MTTEWKGPAGALLVFGAIVVGVAFAFRDAQPTAPPLTSASASASSVAPPSHPQAPPAIPTTAVSVDPKRIAPRASQSVPTGGCPDGSAVAAFTETHGPQRKMKGCARPADGGDSIREGFWTMTSPNGEISEGRYVNGHKDGHWITWYPNGTAARTEEYKMGKYEGIFIEWSAQGQRLAELEFHDNVRDGTSTFWLEDGTIRREHWRQGVRLDAPQDGGV